MPKRDFIFIDESGEPGKVTEYYVVGLIHLTDDSLKSINIHLGAFRYFGAVKRELKSHRLTKLQKEQILNILKISHINRNFFKTSAVYVKKHKYKGPYLNPPNQNPNYFRNLMIRKLLEFHFENNKLQSNELEIVIDRLYSSEKLHQRLVNYLKQNKKKRLPRILHIVQADSRYVELLQIADWISGSVKEKFFTHKEREFSELFAYLNVKEILK